MKILHVVPSYVPAYHHGGAVRAVHTLCRALVRKGLDVTVFTTNINGKGLLDVSVNKPIDIDGVKVIYYPVRFLRSYCYSADLSKAVKKELPYFDLVHMHSVYLYPTMIAAHWCRKYKIPYIVNPFGAIDADMIRLKGYFKKKAYLAVIEGKTLKSASVIHAASIYEKEKILALGFGSRVVVVPRGIDIKEYEKKEGLENLKDIYPQLQGKKIILFLGRIHFKKGFDLLASAFKEVVKKRKDAHLLIVGPDEGGYAAKVKDLFKREMIIDRVFFTGMLLGPQKLSAFYSSDIFILPSYGENFGLAVLEAMACKLPVVITNRVGLYPDVEEYKAGIVTGLNSVEIAAAVLKLLDSENLRKSMGENGKRLIEDRFSEDRVADKMIHVYEEILKGKTKNE